MGCTLHFLMKNFSKLYETLLAISPCKRRSVRQISWHSESVCYFSRISEIFGSKNLGKILLVLKKFKFLRVPCTFVDIPTKNLIRIWCVRFFGGGLQLYNISLLAYLLLLPCILQLDNLLSLAATRRYHTIAVHKLNTKVIYILKYVRNMVEIVSKLVT